MIFHIFQQFQTADAADDRKRHYSPAASIGNLRMEPLFIDVDLFAKLAERQFIRFRQYQEDTALHNTQASPSS